MPADPDTHPFTLARQALSRARQDLEEARRAAFLAGERLRAIAAGQAGLERVFTKGDEAYRERMEALESEYQAAESDLKIARAALAEAEGAESACWSEFLPLAIPPAAIEELDDRYPFLLLPVRIETRFKVVEQGGETRHQLWLRVFPDDCAVDSFEPELSDAEVASMRRYLAQIEGAGEDRAALRGAWKALVASHGSGRAGWMIESYVPGEAAAKRGSWSQPPRVQVMPDRFMVLGFSGGVKVVEQLGEPVPARLVVGPDPLAAEGEELRQENGELLVSSEMKWMVDFEEAVRVGMGFRIDLTPAQYLQGLDRLLVIGVRLSADYDEGRSLLETLLRDHQRSRSGFSLLPQGTPTNNTDRDSSGHSRSEDADASFDLLFGTAAAPPAADWFEKRDGQWLAELLGINRELLMKVANSDGTDQREARAMNLALWPATIGYFMDSMMQNVFEDAAVVQTRWFFTHFVSGRGMLPSIRLGMQPYGILPATAFSRLSWPGSDKFHPYVNGISYPPGAAAFLRDLYGILKKVDHDWQAQVHRVAFLGKPGDAHQLLLDILGLHPGSVEYYQQYSESLEQLYNQVNLEGLGGELVAGLVAAGYLRSGMDILSELGYGGGEHPEVLDKFFLTTPNLLGGPVVEEGRLSENTPLRLATPGPEAKNYIGWLRHGAQSSLEIIRRQTGFIDGRPPEALLYLMLRHAVLLGYYDASLRLYQTAGLLAPEEIGTVRKEAKFIHVAEQPAGVESRWQHLYQLEPRITGQPSLRVVDYIPSVLGSDPGASFLYAQLEALAKLENVPTARLERTFAEHIDLCTYRLDAWKYGLVNYQLASMRYRGKDASAVKGIYLGAFGWLEDLRPHDRGLQPARLDDDLKPHFEGDAQAPLMVDTRNAGYVHAPSLDQAVTAAILRSGYLANATPEDPGALAVDLSSRRMRRALSVIDGIRSGQGLGALLGYKFERGLHDRHDLAEVDRFIYPLRKAFPLVAGRLADGEDTPDRAAEMVPAQNVLDGLSLVERIHQTGRQVYPFGLEGLPQADERELEAISAEVNDLLEVHDAVADLAMAESVHQMAQGNFERAAGTLDAYSKATLPPEPEVLRTPRSGVRLNHRVVLHLDADPASFSSTAPLTPRAAAEPALNRWLAGLLPNPEHVVCQVSYAHGAAGEAVQRIVSQAELGLEPIDLVYWLHTDSEAAMNALDEQVVHYAVRHLGARRDHAVSIAYMARMDGRISFFELSALVASLRSLLLRSRPLRASDLGLADQDGGQDDQAVFFETQRLRDVRQALAALASGTERDGDACLDTLLMDLGGGEPALIANIDGCIETYSGLAARASLFGVPGAGFLFTHDWLRLRIGELRERIQDLVSSWDRKESQFAGVLETYRALPETTREGERYALLQRAEILISATMTAPLPAAPAGLERILAEKNGRFLAKKAELDELLRRNPAALSAWHAQLEAILPLNEFDPLGFDLEAERTQVARFSGELMDRTRDLKRAIEGRTEAGEVRSLLGETGPAEGPTRVEAVVRAARILLGEDFLAIPEFSLAPGQGDEVENSYRDTDQLLSYAGGADPLAGKLASDFPLDDWLYGVARVREKIRHWENIAILTDAFSGHEIGLRPIQLPYRPGDSWLGLSYPAYHQPTGDHLLYTAHFAAPFDKRSRQCGLLLDEWVETIPAREETTGVAFHYDRPGSEPPQVMLLVTPADFTGHWRWDDLVDALQETLDMARQRAIEPAHLEDTGYARFLPATLAAATSRPITIALDLALNNRSRQAPGEAAHD